MTSSTHIKRKILFLTSFTLPDTAGSGINAFRFARFINKRGDKATILTFNRNCKLQSKEVIENVPIYRIPYFNKGLIMKILSLPMVISYFFLFILRNDIIIIFGGKTFAYNIAIMLAFLFRKKIVFRSLLYGVDDYNTLTKSKVSLLGRLKRYLLHASNIYYTINPFIAKSYSDRVPDKSKILPLPQGVDNERFYPIYDEEKKRLRKELKLDETNIIISIGFLINRKGYKEVFDSLSSLNIPFVYIIIGEYNFTGLHFLSNYQDESKKLVHYGQDKLGERLILKGKRENVHRYLQAADIFIHNAENEIPNVVYEAMACGLPVIARNMGADNNFLLENKKNCLLTDEKYSVREAVMELFDNRGLRFSLGSNACKKIEQKAGFEYVYSHLIEYLYT